MRRLGVIVLRYAFFIGFVWPLLLLAFGINVRHRERLPESGPAILVANHNSHVDTLALMALFPLGKLDRIRPVAAEDYFSSGFFGWFTRQVIGILMIRRGAGRNRTEDPFVPVYEALDRGDILILFPEGTRGEPERMSGLKKGIAYLAQKYPGVPIIPVFLHGFGRILPKGDWLPVPFFCDIMVGEPVPRAGSPDAFMAALTARLLGLSAERRFPAFH